MLEEHFANTTFSTEKKTYAQPRLNPTNTVHTPNESQKKPPGTIFNQGYTSFVHKADALMYVLGLETHITSDRQADLARYGQRVISCLSDQGAQPFFNNHFLF